MGEKRALTVSFAIAKLLPIIRKPVLITHGAQDAAVKPSMLRQHKISMQHAEIQMVENAGHAVSWEDTARFNQRQREFAENAGQKAQAARVRAS